MAAAAGHVVGGVVLAVALAASGHAKDAADGVHSAATPTVHRASTPTRDLPVRSAKARTYDLTLAPGADARAVRLETGGARSLRLDASGALLITNALGVRRAPAPVAWQTARDGSREAVLVRYVLLDGRTIGLRIGAHDPARAVTIRVPMAVNAGGTPARR
jgi:hypothetical protein